MAWAIWITGLPGSGKTTVAQGAAALAAAAGRQVRTLELDAIRQLVTPEPTYSEEERGVLYRALAVMASLLVEAGSNVIVDATANRRAYRDLARRLIPRFAEVYMRCPIEVCRAREGRRFGGGRAPARIYERADRSGAPVPGAGVPYEPPEAPDLVIDSATVSPGEAAAQVWTLVERLEAPDLWRAAVLWRSGSAAPGRDIGGG
ncbi:MAG TPA: adenylyl-sulfate kinase [Candidatus Methylomirabilis sp.]|jgi:adenylylsulfate kinase